ncbi:MAG: tyrosine-type recombinase/integrase [Elusimicrobia bacterium]|nr:tyrosine-type recombinase/integrase [Elusimicrobiota bacterium]
MRKQQRPARFSSLLKPYLKAYLEFKQKLGYTSFYSRAYLARDLDYYALFYRLSSLREFNEVFIAHWIHSAPRAGAATKNIRLGFVRVFCRYLIRLGVIQDNPALKIHRLKQKPFKPHIYTLQEIHRIFEQTRTMQRKRPHRLFGRTMEVMLLLIYACGLRLGEALRLKIKDVDFEENLLRIHNAKFHKNRLVPFAQSIRLLLENYLALRLKFYPAPDGNAPFFCHRGLPYTHSHIEKYFRKLRQSCGLGPFSGRLAPRIHDLRRAFAIHKLYQWYQQGHDLSNKLPLLAAYMGHVNISATQTYLNITLDLLREGDKRFRSGFGGLAEKALHRVRVR